MNKDEAYKIHHEWIDKCLMSDNLTEWEVGFVESVKQQLERKGSISARQIEVLEKIYADKTN
jgi:hypothetical protein